MIRAALTGLLLLVSGPIHAQAFVCPFVTIGWSQTWYNQPIQSVSYDSALQLLYVVFGAGAGVTVSAFSNVPLGVIQGFSSTPNPLGYYNSAVVSRYHPLVLAQTNNCPLLFENGAYLWAR